MRSRQTTSELRYDIETRGGMTDGSDNGHAAALAMLVAFASVGATHFDLTWTTSAGDKDGFRRGVSPGELRRKLPAMIDTASTTQRNVIKTVWRNATPSPSNRAGLFLSLAFRALRTTSVATEP